MSSITLEQICKEYGSNTCKSGCGLNLRKQAGRGNTYTLTATNFLTREVYHTLVLNGTEANSYLRILTEMDGKQKVKTPKQHY